MVLESNTRYGATSDGGQFYSGTLFKVNTDGTGFVVLKRFSQYALDPLL